MEQRRKLNKQTVIIGAIVLLVIIIAIFSFLNRPRNYYHGISVQFESEASVEYEHSILGQYHDNAMILDADDLLPHDYTLAFPNMSERKVKEITHSLSDTEYVHDAHYVRVVNLTGPLDASK